MQTVMESLDCVDSTGAVCTPTDNDVAGKGDYHLGGIYAGVVAECFCNEDCSDCVDSDGAVCTPSDAAVSSGGFLVQA